MKPPLACANPFPGVEADMQRRRLDCSGPTDFGGTKGSVNTGKPTFAIQGIELTALEANPVAVSVSARVDVECADAGETAVLVRAEVFEVGFDGGKPSSPLTTASAGPINIIAGQPHPAKVGLRIGTPFFWTEQTRHRYAIIVLLTHRGEIVARREAQFGVLARGEIVATAGSVKALPAQPKLNLHLPSLFVVSDSTAFSNGENQLGWGDPLAGLLDGRLINVFNRARPGRSTRSFRNEGLWHRVEAELKPGDFVLIQFGHNDADRLAEGRCRGVLPGTGEETRGVMLPDRRSETVHTYGWYLRQFIAETRAKGATPILLSPTAKNIWEHGRLKRDQSEHAHWTAQVAHSVSADYVDVAQIIADRYDALGQEAVQPLFCSPNDNVHTSPAGAELNAACVVAGLAKLLGRRFETFSPGKDQDPL